MQIIVLFDSHSEFMQLFVDRVILCTTHWLIYLPAEGEKKFYKANQTSTDHNKGMQCTTFAAIIY